MPHLKSTASAPAAMPVSAESTSSVGESLGGDPGSWSAGAPGCSDGVDVPDRESTAAPRGGPPGESGRSSAISGHVDDGPPRGVGLGLPEDLAGDGRGLALAEGHVLEQIQEGIALRPSEVDVGRLARLVPEVKETGGGGGGA